MASFGIHVGLNISVQLLRSVLQEARFFNLVTAVRLDLHRIHVNQQSSNKKQYILGNIDIGCLCAISQSSK